MERNIQQCLVTYFKALEKHNLFCQEINESFISILNRIQSKDRNLQLIRSAEIDEFRKLDDIKERVVRAILLELDELLETFKSLVKKLDKSTTDLRNKLIAFEKSVAEYNYPETSALTTGNSLQPALSKLLESANDSLMYYHGYLSGIEIDLQNEDFLDEKSVENMIESLKENKLYKDVVNNILVLTQFCSQNDFIDALE